MRYKRGNKIKKSFREQNSITTRIIKDVLGGIAISLCVSVFLLKVYDFLVEKWPLINNIEIMDFDIQEIFFTELSLVFLVISFVTLLANKTQTVYWVDVIQYRLIKPTRTSIVDITSYIFANLLISLFAYIFPFMSKLILFSFVFIIVLLGFLCVKLLVSFFGIEGLKEDLEKEYRNALEFRKVICQMKYVTSGEWMKTLFGTGIFQGDKYAGVNVREFGTNIPLDETDEEIQELHNRLIRKRERNGERIRIHGRYDRRLYKKLLRLSKKFNGNTNAFASMRDNLYSNTIKCIEEIKINEASEQIRFLLKYKEYEHALSCIKLAAEKCPIAFLDVFNDELDVLPEDTFCIEALNRELYSLRTHYQYATLKDSKSMKNAMLFLANRMADDIYAEMVEEQLKKALEENDSFVAGLAYKSLFLERVKRSLVFAILDIEQSTVYLKYYNKVVMQAMSKDINLYRAIDSWTLKHDDKKSMEEIAKENNNKQWIKFMLEEDRVEIAYEMLKRYRNFLKEFFDLSNDLWGNSRFARGTAQTERDKIKEVLASTCVLSNLYLVLEKKHTADKIDTATFLRFLALIGECYDYFVSYGWVGTELYKNYKENLLYPVAVYLAKKKIALKTPNICPRFWRDVKNQN